MKRLRPQRIQASETREPKWNLIFPRGTWHGANLAPIGGSINLDDDIFSEMVANWKEAGSPPLPLWFNHPDDTPPIGVPADEWKKAAGWYEDLRITEAGLEGLTKWTPNAAARIEADEFRFISPEWTDKATDRRTGESMGWWLYGAALLNDPFFNEMPRVAASAVPTQSGPAPQEKKSMDKKMICAALGLPEDTADEAVMAAITKLCSGMKCAAEETEKLTASHTAVVEPLKATLTAAQAEVTKLQARVAELETAKTDTEVNALAEKLIAERRILPAQKAGLVAYAKATSLKAATEMFSAFPVSVAHQGELGVAGKESDVTDLKALQANYDVEMGKLIASGKKSMEATRELGARKEFAPLFVITPNEKPAASAED